MGRVGQMHELRNLATFLMADGCNYLTGETIVIDQERQREAQGSAHSISDRESAVPLRQEPRHALCDLHPSVRF
jgi:hypothetical protein